MIQIQVLIKIIYKRRPLLMLPRPMAVVHFGNSDRAADIFELN